MIRKKSILDKKKCDRCSNPLDIFSCYDCRLRKRNMEIFFDKNYSCFIFESDIKKIVNYAKFLNKEFVFYHLGKLMADLLDIFLERENFIIIPVPISRKRFLLRGFNPAYFLAKNLSEKLKIPFINKSLMKVFDNKRQSKLSYKKRIKNPYNQYNIVNNENIFGKNVYLLDDIFTTGSTVNECSRILKDAGANKVIAVTFAKTLLS